MRTFYSAILGKIQKIQNKLVLKMSKPIWPNRSDVNNTGCFIMYEQE